jgi:hypothetical protein
MAAALAGGSMPDALAQAHGKRGAGDGVMAAPKRAGPPAVAPIVTNGMRIVAVNESRKRGLPQNGGYLEALDRASGKSLWLLRVYQIDYDANMEADVQDRFIEKLELKADRKTVLVTDESGKRYEVDLQSREVTALP